MDNIEILPITNGNIARPIWSVMIPTYNCAGYLRITLQSVLVQDRGVDNMEIWVVDDCSTMGDPESVVKELGNGRVKFFRQNKNVGQLKNFETCLNLSSGIIIHLLHGDDFVHPGFYEKLEQPMLSDSSVGAAFTHHHYVNEQGESIYSYDRAMGHAGVLKDFVYTIASRQVIQTPSIVVKREVYEKIGGFNKTLNWCEDWEMWIRIACHYNFYYEPALLASYRMHTGSNTADSARKGRFIDDILNCIKIYPVYLPVHSSCRKQVVRNAKKHYLKYALVIGKRAVYQSRNIEVALQVLYKALWLTYNLSSFSLVIKSIFKVIFGFYYGKLRSLSPRSLRRVGEGGRNLSE